MTSLLAIACSRSDSAPSVATAQTPASGGVSYAYDRLPMDTARTPGAVVDSVFAMPEMIRRFRDGLPPTAALIDAPRSQRDLVEQFVRALGQSDRMTLGRLTLSRAEFAYVYYPLSPDAQRDNGLPPQRRWDQLTLASEKGIGRALTRLGQRALTFDAVTCAEAPVRSGALTVHNGCTVRVKLPDGTTFNGPLFSAIIEFAGGFKFYGYANDM